MLSRLFIAAGKGLTSEVELCFGHFPMWYSGSGVVLYCIDSQSFTPFLLCNSLS